LFQEQQTWFDRLVADKQADFDSFLALASTASKFGKENLVRILAAKATVK